ncbi:MAG: DUF429 domain-containing protein [Acidimicrobiales bacterium]
MGYPAVVRSSPWGALAVGIDVAEEKKGLDLVALDNHRSVVASAGRLSVTDTARIVLEELRPAIVCIDSPSSWSISGRSREAERELRGLGISAFATGPDPGPHPFYRWMRVGMAVYRSLAGTYQTFRGAPAAGTAAEVFPEASAALLAGRFRNRDETKLAFRRHVLGQQEVDPARLATLDRVDAALAALTGVFALEGIFSTVGDPEEGVILLPVARLQPLGRMRQ